MTSRLRWLITELARHLWVRASVFAVAGILTAIAAIALAPLIPADWSGKIGAASIGNVLQILASSMLAVTTFSLATMVAALLTPPARVLVITDGVRGSHLALPDGTRHHQPAFPAEPLVDTTGCGDVYHGAFLHGWLAGWPAPQCAEFASRLAARTAEGLGGRHAC